MRSKLSPAVVVLGFLLFSGSSTAGADSSSAPAAGLSNKGRPGKVWTNSVVLKAEVVAVDYDKRTLSLKDSDGNVVELEVDPSVQRFSAIKKGDTVTTHYLESFALYVQSPQDATAENGATSYRVANKGEKPSGVITRTHQITATIEKINKDAREITVKGPEGNLQTIKVGPEVKRFNELKVGDQIVAKTTVAVAISVAK